jgi:hypothetical protein
MRAIAKRFAELGELCCKPTETPSDAWLSRIRTAEDEIVKQVAEDDGDVLLQHVLRTELFGQKDRDQSVRRRLKALALVFAHETKSGDQLCSATDAAMLMAAAGVGESCNPEEVMTDHTLEVMCCRFTTLGELSVEGALVYDPESNGLMLSRYLYQYLMHGGRG